MIFFYGNVLVHSKLGLFFSPFPQVKSLGSDLCMEVLKKPSEKSTTTLAVAPCQQGAVEERQQWIWITDA